MSKGNSSRRQIHVPRQVQRLVLEGPLPIHRRAGEAARLVEGVWVAHHCARRWRLALESRALRRRLADKTRCFTAATVALDFFGFPVQPNGSSVAPV